jgi:hydrogenase-4 component B
MSDSTILLLLVFWPLLGALCVPWLGRRSERLRDCWVVLVSGASLLGSVVLAMRVVAAGPLEAGLPLLVGRLAFAADPIGALFALFSAFVWFCATLYSLAYMKSQQARDRYHAASLVVFSAMFGVVLAGDLVTLFLFFETLGLVSFLLVVHTGTPEARRAAIQYFWMTILGGIALLAGIMMVYAMGGGPLITPAPVDEATGYRAAAAVLLVLGFGVKAGMVPVHFWLPNAHPVAPSPASALLSGVLIKAGAYGIFRSVTAVFRPETGTAFGAAPWEFYSQFGLAVLWAGIVTMAVGVILALGQSNTKRMLAYHSISQMGFILAGIGAGGYLVGEGAMGTAGGLMHTVNHALFKASLFLGVGAVAFRAGSLDMYALGGLWRKMPVTFAFMLIAAAGISGVPLFNGFVSKCLIHHALETAQQGGAPGIHVAEGIYLLVCAGTAASFIKLIGLVFLGRTRLARPESVREAPPAMLAAMALLSVPVIVLGWRPGLLLEGLIAPGLLGQGLPADGIVTYLGHYFLSGRDVMMSLIILAMGAVIFAVGMKFGLFHLHLPPWLSVAYWFQRTGHGIAAVAMQRAVGTHARHGGPGEQLLASMRGISQRYESVQQQGGLLGELLLAVFRGITLAYGRVQNRVAWFLRAARRRLLLGLGEAGLARRQLVESLLVGLPSSPAQAFLEAAWGAVEQERHATVRAALAEVGSAVRPGRVLEERAQESRFEAIRALAGLMAAAVFEARLERLGAQAREGGADAVRAGFAALHREFGATRSAIIRAAADLADARVRGEDIVRALSERIEPVLAREARAIDLGAVLPDAPASATGTPLAQPRQARRWRNAFGAWLRDMVRLAIAELRQHPSSWPHSESLDTAPGVVSARRSIQRYARDVALNIVAIFLLFALFFLLL